MTSLDYIQGRMIPFHPHSFGIRRRHKKNLMLNQKPCEILENSHSDDVKDLGCTDFFDPLASNFQQVEFKDGEKSAESKEEFTVSDVCNGNDEDHNMLKRLHRDVSGGSVFTSPYEALYGDETSPTVCFTSGKTWSEKKALVQKDSAFGDLKGWELKSFIVKVGDDLQKEILAIQLIDLFQLIITRIFQL